MISQNYKIIRGEEPPRKVAEEILKVADRMTDGETIERMCGTIRNGVHQASEAAMQNAAELVAGS
jgi:hypothetical protein